MLDIETVPNPVAGWEPPPEHPERMGPPQAQRAIAVCGLHLVPDEQRQDRFTPVFMDYGPPPEEIPPPEVAEAVDEVREYHMMLAVSQHMETVVAAGGTVVTYNGRGFDIPVLYARMMAFGIQAPWYTADFRYRFSKTGHLDLLDILVDYGAVYPAKPGLAVMCRLCGLPGKMGIDGSMVAGYYAQGCYAEIREYCLGDNFELGILTLRWLHTKGKITLDVYRDTVSRIIARCQEKDAAGNFVHPFLAEMVARSDRKRLLLDPTAS